MKIAHPEQHQYLLYKNLSMNLATNSIVVVSQSPVQKERINKRELKQRDKETNIMNQY